MKLDIVLPLVLILLIIPIVGAYETLLESTISSGGTFTEYNTTYTLFSGNKVKILRDNQSFFINNQTCQDIDHIKVCVNDTAFESADIVVYSLLPRIYFNFSVYNETATVGEDVIIPIYFNNSGGSRAYISFEMELPSEVEIRQLDGLDLIGHTIKWDGYLDKNYYQWFDLIVRPLQAYNFTYNPVLKYYDGLSNKEITDEVSTETELFFDYEISLVPDSVILGNQSILNLTITNLDEDYNISSRVDYDLSDNLGIDSFSNSARRSSRWRENINHEGNVTGNNELVIYGLNSGTGKIIVTMTLTDYSSVEEEIVKTLELPVVPLDLTIKGLNSTFNAEEINRLTITMDNPYSNVWLKNIVARFNSQLMAIPTMYHSTLKPGEGLTLFNEIITPDDLGKDVTYPITVEIQAETNMGEQIRVNKTGFLTIISKNPKSSEDLNIPKNSTLSENLTSQKDNSNQTISTITNSTLINSTITDFSITNSTIINNSSADIIQQQTLSKVNVSNSSDEDTLNMQEGHVTPIWKYIVLGILIIILLLALDYANDFRKEQKSLKGGDTK